ncbi:MAG TPA: hypothetical protein VKH37_02395 [Ferruginibacter sp.]|nr:hypothetical protein [Ferruginibacter sp.]
MKKILTFAVAAIIVANTTTSCTKNDDNSISSQVAALVQTAQTGNWKITSYIDNGVDETNHYTGYTFQFTSGGTVVATKTGATTVNGTWSGGNDDSTLKLVLNFGAATPFLELNDDWHVTQQSSAIIKLEDVSGGGGGTEYLTFEKI